MRPLPFLLASLLLPVSPARADLVIGRDARTGVSLTIYGQQDLALVRETRSAELGTGEEALRFDEVPARLDPTTVTLGATTTRPASPSWSRAT